MKIYKFRTVKKAPITLDNVEASVSDYLTVNPPIGGLTFEQIKADSQVLSVINNSHALGSDNQDLTNLVVKETGKGLSTNDFTTEEKNKLSGIAAGAEVNVQADWNQADTQAKDFIKNKPVISGGDPFIAKLIVNGDKPTGANVTPVTLDISFNYEANKTYVIDIFAMVAPGVAGTGCGFLIDVSTVVNYVGSFTIHQLANTGTVSGGSSIGDLGATTMGVSSGMAGTGANFVSGSALLITGANPGTATFFFRSETTAVTTCKSGSVFRIMKIN